MEQTHVFVASMMMSWGKSKKSFLSHSGVDMGTFREPRNESSKATLARIKKEMAQPRIAKSARKGASNRQDPQ